MIVNENKSGLMKVYKSEVREKDEFDGIPVVTTYKYLGLQMDAKLTMDGHLNFINKKIVFLNNKLVPVRMLDFMELNINLYKLMILPLYRLTFALYQLCTITQQ